MKLLKRSYVTLLEILLVLTILSFTAGLVTINIFKAVREQHFRSDVAQVVDFLRLAQNIMLIMDTDVYVRLKSTDGENPEISLEFDHATVSGWGKELRRPSKKLKSIRYAGGIETDEEGAVLFKFLSRGSIITQGIFTLATADPNVASRFTTTLIRYIVLPGFPSPIYSQAEDPLKAPPKKEKLIEWDNQLTNLTHREIKEADQFEKTTSKEK